MSEEISKRQLSQEYAKASASFLKLVQASQVTEEIQDLYICATHAVTLLLGSIEGNVVDKTAGNDICIFELEDSEDSNTGNHNTGDSNTGDYNNGKSNTGDNNVGNMNTGCSNTGDCNSNNQNTGNNNAGAWNTGHFNAGCNNAGHKNTGKHNTGDSNTGNHNTGDSNTGDWNKSSFNTGCFNTKDHEIMLFDKSSNMTYKEWTKSTARFLLERMPNSLEWVDEKDMADEEKRRHPTYETTGGYLKVLTKSKLYRLRQLWWNELNDDDKNTIKSIPNFDAAIFKKCTGIDVNANKLTDCKISAF